MLFNSIRNKMIIFLLAATLIPILASIFITYSLTTSKVTEETLKSNADLLFQGKTNLLNYLNGIHQATFILYNDSELFDVLEHGIKLYTDNQEIYRGLSLLSYTAKDVEQLHLYIRKNDLHFLIVNDRSSKNFMGDNGKYIPPNLSKGNSYIEPPHRPDNYGLGNLPKPTTDQVISFHSSLYYLAAKEELGTLSVDVRMDGIRTIVDQLYSAGKEELYILDENKHVIYSSEGKAGVEPLEATWVTKVLQAIPVKDNFAFNQDHFSGEIIYEKMTTPYLKWTIIKRIPNETLHQTAREVALINSGIVVLFLILTILATVIIAFQLTAPIKKLIRSMNQIQSGNLQATIDVARKDEFGILARRFQLAMNTINELIIREYELELARKTNELNVLQVQTNPHFMNNALQSIGTLALQKQEPEIYNLIASLGKMMRYSMNAGEPIVTLARELDYVKAYFALQRQRFGEQLEYTVHMDEALLKLQIPKMILQPLVENYFKHGFDVQLETGTIAIYVELSADKAWLWLEVSDNGKGISEDELKALQEKLLHTKAAWENGESGIGLANILSRLKLYYNETARLEVVNNKQNGFSIVLWIPLEKEGESVEGIDR
ncbi:sensor histidine kinase [Paenibacillus psychroresistens]|uniref:histidine kinase n=1 Tax=Paenibacillus psychroresistens TaxID=1778678 RepID=A0A6B8RQP2_9BACL|nr:histidine kinase [Paenibacillus psychroresistens]QGQ97865.1 sensor histidine kinase [Paenibacillus psychroresistens]